MAGVISKPGALSFSGNMNEFVLSSSDVVLFSLKRGSALLFEQSYEPGPDGMIRIDLKNIVEDQLSYTLDAAQTIYTQPNLCADFTATINGNDYSFRVIKGGVANFQDTASNWLKLHFLTWQPRIKQITYYSPEWLTYYAVEACSVKLKATYPDQSTKTISLQSCTAGSAYTFNLQYSVISGKLGNTYPSYYEVWAERTGGTRLSELQVYAFSDVRSEDEQWYIFENSLGGLDTFRAYGTNNLNAEHEHNIADIGDVRKEYQVDTERKYTKNTGYLDEYERRWLLDFFPSRKKYVYEASGIRKIVVTESSATYVSNELPSNYTFTWQLADISVLLNLIKNEIDIPDNLIAPDLSSPDFILPPRLAEFPRVQLSEGVLIPAFDPFNPKPTVTTFGAILDTIKNAVVKELEDELSGIIGGGGGGGSDIYIIKTNDLTIPTDQNVFSAKRTLQEIDSLLIEANEMFLRKDIPDTARDVITFDKKIGSTVFLDGMDGKGWEIRETGAAMLGSAKVRSDLYVGNKVGSPTFACGFAGWGVEVDIPTATAEMDNLFVRKTFTAYEIVYSQIYGLGGSQIVSDLNKIASVEVLPDRYRCYMDDMDGLMLMNLRKGDGVRIQTRTGTTSIKYLMGRCIGVDSEYFDIAIPLLEGTGQPEAGDFAMRWGNKDDINRQGLIYLTTADSGAPFIDVYDGITNVSTEGKLKARLGNLKGVRTLRGDQLKGYGAYLNGVYVENSTFYTDNGETVDQRFMAMDGKFSSAIEGIKNDMSLESGNLLRNSSFGRDTNYWATSNTVHFINVSGDYLWMDGHFYAEKSSVADIYRDGSKNVLRIRNASICQLNTLISGEKEEGLYSIAFYYKAIRPGILSVGFEGQELYSSLPVQTATEYVKFAKYGKWDGKGDFRIGFTGEILIYGVSLFNDRLADLQIKLQTQIEQTTEYIKLLATKDYVDRETGAIYTRYDSKLQVTAEQISGVSTKIDNINHTISTAGWITTADGNRLYATVSTVSSLTGRVSTAESSISNNAYAITQKVSSTDYNGQTIISKVNQTSTTYQIDAKNINLNGVVTANQYFKILTDGSMQTIAGTIGGFRIESGGIFSERYTTGGSNEKFFLHSSGSSGFLGFSSSTKWVGIGLNTLPSVLGGTNALARFEDNTPNYSTNYGLSIAVTGGSRNIALAALGDVIIKGAMYTTKYTSFSPTSNNNAIPIENGDKILLYSSNYSTVYLPSRASLAEALGVSSSAYFNVRITLIPSNWGVGSYNIFPSPGMTLFNGSGNSVSSLSLSKNQVRDFIITASDTYYAYITS